MHLFIKCKLVSEILKSILTYLNKFMERGLNVCWRQKNFDGIDTLIFDIFYYNEMETCVTHLSSKYLKTGNFTLILEIKDTLILEKIKIFIYVKIVLRRTIYLGMTRVISLQFLSEYWMDWYGFILIHCIYITWPNTSLTCCWV